MKPVFQQGNALLGRILAMDPEMLRALKPYNGRRLAVIVTGTRYHFHAVITGNGIELDDTPESEPDVTVRGTPSEFMAFLRTVPAGGSPASASLEIAGDIGLAQELQGLFNRLDPDWEEYLSDWVGDTLARKLGNLARSSTRFLINTGQTLGSDFSEYLRYEKEVLPDRSELEEFNNEVDTLRDDVERLRVRINRLHLPGKT